MTSATAGRVDVGALAGAAMGGAHRRIGAAISSLLSELSDTSNPLNDVQQAALFTALLSTFDGFERELAARLVCDLRLAGVDVWGLPSELEDLDA